MKKHPGKSSKSYKHELRELRNKVERLEQERLRARSRPGSSWSRPLRERSRSTNRDRTRAFSKENDGPSTSRKRHRDRNGDRSRSPCYRKRQRHHSSADTIQSRRQNFDAQSVRSLHDSTPRQYEVCSPSGSASISMEVLSPSGSAFAIILNSPSSQTLIDSIETNIREEGTNTSNEVHTELNVDTELLNLLGDDPAKVQDNNFSIVSELKNRWAFFLANGVKSEILKEYQDSNPCPDNLPTLKPPMLNPELAAILAPDKLKRERLQISFQQDILHALSALGRLINCALQADSNIRKNSVLLCSQAAAILSNPSLQVVCSKKILCLSTHDRLCCHTWQSSSH